MTDGGYFIANHVLSEDECDGLTWHLSAQLGANGRAGARHLMSDASIGALSQDLRLLKLAHQALGRALVPFRATLFAKSAQSNWLIAWHQDTALPLCSRFEDAEWGPWSEKRGVPYAHAPTWALSRVVALRVHLDASTFQNGPLRVIPGSHKLGVLNDQDVLDYARNQIPVECTVPRGGVLAMSPLLIHASSKATSLDPRRVLHIEYADTLDLAPSIRLAIA
jgi:hypothetical protein